MAMNKHQDPTVFEESPKLADGVAVIETFSKCEQDHSFVVNSHVSMFEPATRQRLDALQQYFMGRGITAPQSAMYSTVVAVGKIIRSQATLKEWLRAEPPIRQRICRRIDEPIVRSVPE
jgi:hypothetical protein